MSQKKQTPKTTYGTINDWSEALRKSGYNKLSEGLIENEKIKLDGLKTLEELNLPRLKRITTPLKDFLKIPAKYFKKLDSSTFHISLLSNIEGKSRLRSFPHTPTSALKFIAEKVLPEEKEKFTITVSEYYGNAYGGNVVVNTQGKIILELVEGIHLDLVLGSQTPIATGIRDFSFEEIEFFADLQLKKYLTSKKLLKLLKEIVNFVDSRPGYYEFVLGYDKKNPAKLFPIFIDFRNQPHYLNLI